MTAVLMAVVLVLAGVAAPAPADTTRADTAWQTCGGTIVDGVAIAVRAITPQTTTLTLVKPLTGNVDLVSVWTRLPGRPCHFTKTSQTQRFSTAPALRSSSTTLVATRVRPWVSCGPAALDGVRFATIPATVAALVTVNQTTGSYAAVKVWQRLVDRPCHFTVVVNETGRIGARGTVPGSLRKQDTFTTPTGTYTMTTSFGNGARPSTALTWKTPTRTDYWVQDNDSAHYNSYRSSLQGGFRTSESEQLTSFGAVYRYSVVINFNMPPNAVRQRGAGIFLHVNGAGATAGCVSISQAAMLKVMHVLKPGDVIGISS